MLREDVCVEATSGSAGPGRVCEAGGRRPTGPREPGLRVREGASGRNRDAVQQATWPSVFYSHSVNAATGGR